MRGSRFVFLLFFLTFANSALAHQATASSPQATALLQQSLATLTSGHPITDVTLSGTVERVAGSDDESGTVVLRALAAGASRMDLTLPIGNRSEVMNASTSQPVGSWSGPDGTPHPAAYHNLLAAPAWFFPAFSMARGLSAGYLTSYIGQETRNGEVVEHIMISQIPNAVAPPTAPWFQHLSEVDFFLDSNTFLPAAITFKIHPDDNALLDIPVEIDFSNYTAVNGTQVPFHIQKYINNSLSLDLQIQNVTFNSGISADAFNAGAGL